MPDLLFLHLSSPFSCILVLRFPVLHFWLFCLALKPLIILKFQRFIFPIYIKLYLVLFLFGFSLFGSYLLAHFNSLLLLTHISNFLFNSK